MLSIIIPVKNEEELIKNSIDQLLNEMENIELELIVIDDYYLHYAVILLASLSQSQELMR